MQCLNILLVDDDEIFLEIAASAIIEAFPGASVLQMSRPDNVNGILKSRNFDCLVIDYKMPSVDGITVARGVESDFPYLPIILITGVGDEEIATMALRSGISDYMSKAKISPESLRRAIERAIELCGHRRTIDVQREELEMFAHALAHDFKQPLRQINTFAKLIADELDSSGSAPVRTHLRFMCKAASRLTALVDVMSEYTLLHRPLLRELVSVKKVAAAAMIALAEYTRKRNGAVLNRAEGDMFANPTMMTYVIQNLIENGLKYNIHPRPSVKIQAQRNGLHCEISVSDNGIGIAEAQREAIFAPLARLHTRDEFPGTGLGLTLARRALASQHGTIVCHANPGGGSRFVIAMPYSRP